MADETKSEVQIIGPNQVVESSRNFETPMPRRDRGSLTGKTNELIEQMHEFMIETHVILDGIAEKIGQARKKREEAAEAQHAHYDRLIGGFQDAVDAVQRLSNLPLEKGSKR